MMTSRLGKVPCVRALGACVHSLGPKVHLVYFAAVSIEAHGYYGTAAMACLTVGLLSEITGAPAL